MRLLITLVDGTTITGAIQGYGGECATIERAREFIGRLHRLYEKSNAQLHDVYVKRDWNPITNEHTRVDVHVTDIARIDEITESRMAA